MSAAARIAGTTPPTACPAWAKLAAHAESARETRIAQLFAEDPRRAELFAECTRRRGGTKPRVATASSTQSRTS